MGVGLIVGPLVLFRGRKPEPEPVDPDYRDAAITVATRMLHDVTVEGRPIPWPDMLSSDEQLFGAVCRALDAAEWGYAARLYLEAWVRVQGDTYESLYEASWRFRRWERQARKNFRKKSVRKG